MGIILFGMVIGAVAQWILGASATGVDWTMAIVAGLVGSIVGALIVTVAWRYLAGRKTSA